MTKYKHPKKLPVKIDNSKFIKVFAEAYHSLGVLEGSQRNLQNPILLIAPLTTKEATASSRIEGTYSDASDVFIFEATGKERKKDTLEVANYRKAMLSALEDLKNGREFSLHFIKSLHGILLKGVRHRGKIGSFRDKDVFIAEKAGDPIEKALYVPPEPFLVSEYMENLIDYVRNSEDDTLIKAGLFHYQFEAIHPFEDGNGRMGRLLIPVLLLLEGQLSLPILYLSGFFDKNRDLYLAKLNAVDQNYQYEEWLKFFLEAVKQQSKHTQGLVNKIYNLYDKKRKELEKEAPKSPYVIPCLEFLFISPVLTLPRLKEEIKASRTTCVRLINLFQKKNLIRELPGRHKRAKIYIFQELLKFLAV